MPLRIETRCDAFRAGMFGPLDLFEKQAEALHCLTDHSTKELLYGGGAGGGKSWLGCVWLLWMCLSYPGTRYFIGRKHLTEIRQSTIVTFQKVCKRYGIPAEMWKYNDNSVTITFENGSVIKGLELSHKPGDKDFDTFGSMEFTSGWIEEAGGVPVKAYEVLRSRIGRHLNDKYKILAKIFITANPARNWLYSIFYLPYRNGVLQDTRRFIQALAIHNTKRESGYLEQLEGLTGETRARLLLGDWEYEDDPLSLIEFDAIADLFTNSYLRPDNLKRRLVCDVAMHGADLFRLGVFYGDVLMEHRFMPKSGGAQVIKAIKDLQAKHTIRAAHTIYDADGVGAFIGKQGGFLPGAVAFHGNAAPITAKGEKSKFANLKAQCGFALAEKINEGGMWAKAVTKEEDREMLSEELAQIKKAKGQGDDKLRLRRKEDVIQDLGRSPDFADLFLMKQYFDISEAVLKPAKPRPIAAF